MKRTGVVAILVFVCGIVALLAQPCLAAEAKIIKVGTVNGLTGWMAAGEQPTNDGMKLAADWINQTGGITVKGVKYKIQLITEDSKSSPEGMADSCTKLVEKDKVKFILGGVNTVMNIAASSVTEPAKVFRLSNYTCGNPEESGPQFPLTFFSNSNIQSMRPQLVYLKETHPEAKRLALSHPGDGAGKWRRAHLEPYAQELGMTVVYSEEWPGETVDFTPVVKKALASNPDAYIFTDGWAYHAGAQIKALRALGFKGAILSTDSEIVSEVLQLTGSEAGEGYFASAWDVMDPNMRPIMKKEVVPRASARLGKINQWQPWGWNTVWILKQAIESAQSLDPVVVAKNLRTMKKIETVFGTATIGGEKTFGSKCVISAPQAIFVAKGGQAVFVRWNETSVP